MGRPKKIDTVTGIDTVAGGEAVDVAKLGDANAATGEAATGIDTVAGGEAVDVAKLGDTFDNNTENQPCLGIIDVNAINFPVVFVVKNTTRIRLHFHKTQQYVDPYQEKELSLKDKVQANYVLGVIERENEKLATPITVKVK